MKTVKRSNWEVIRVYLLSLAFYVLAGCSFSYQDVEFGRAKSDEQAKSFKSSMVHYKRVIKRNPESEQALTAARRAARIALLEIKDFHQAIAFYKHLVVYSKDAKERVDSQKKIAEIYFEKIGNYPQAIIEYGRLLKLPHTKDENYFFRSRIAKSHFQVNNFYQSLVEVNALLEEKPNTDKEFDLKLFKANIFLTTKKIDDAILVFNELLKMDPQKAQIENVGINLSVAHEEKKDFEKAIEVLESIKESYPTQEFIELKIKRLKERAENQPGAKGLKR